VFPYIGDTAGHKDTRFQITTEQHVLLMLQRQTHGRSSSSLRLQERLAYGQHQGESYALVTGLLGKNLLELGGEGGKHAARNVLVLAAEGVSLLQELHAANFVHRDIKPENLVLGVAGSKAARKLHLIDFGTAESLVDRNGARRTAPQAAEGSLPYMAVSVHNQNALGKRDDVEAFVWTLLRLCLGILPWEVSV
jgi:serine/threonine protein kinase